MSEQQAPQIRADVTVVTPENFAQYVDEKMGITPVDNESPEAIAEKEQEVIDAKKASDEADKVAAEDPTHDAELPEEKKKGINERFSKLSSAKKAAEEAAAKAMADAKASSERAARLEREAEELRNKYEPKKTEQDPEPQPGQFNTVDEYAKAVKEWSADNALRQHEKQIQENAQKAQQEATVNAWKERQETVKAAIPDYATTIAGSDLMVSDQIRDAIIESDVGPQILYHLAKNPDIAKDLSELTVQKALIKFGKLEASLATGEAKQQATTKIAEVSKAPVPISPLKGSVSVSGNKIDAKGEFIGTYDEWKALRKAGKIQ